MDIDLPGMSGVEALRGTRDEGHPGHCPDGRRFRARSTARHPGRLLSLHHQAREGRRGLLDALEALLVPAN
jgi:hypothetical protein